MIINGFKVIMVDVGKVCGGPEGFSEPPHPPRLRLPLLEIIFLSSEHKATSILFGALWGTPRIQG